MKHWGWLVFLVVATGAVLFLGNVRNSRAKAEAAPVALATPQLATDTPAPTAPPTIDIAPTLQAAQDAVASANQREQAAQAEARAAIEAKNEALRAALAAQKAVQDAQLNAAYLTATVEAEQNRHAEQVQMVEATRAAENSAAAIRMKQAEAEADKAEAARISAETEAKMTGWKTAGMFTLSLAGFIAALALLRLAWRNVPAPEAEEADPEDETTHDVPNGQFVTAISIDTNEHAKLRAACVEFGGVLSRRKLSENTDKREKYFTEPRAREILAELQRPRPSGMLFAKPGPNEVTVMTGEGWKWLGLREPASPTAPPVEISPEPAKSAE